MPNARVLVIDDDPMITQLLKEHLSNEGFDVTTVHLAEEGFRLATQSPPDLIFLDVMLPDATGYQMVGRFRENPMTESVPIIMMTGTARHANQQQIGKNMGASEYVLKPFDVIAVGNRARQLIKIKPEAQEKIPQPVEILRHAEPAVFVPEDPEPEAPASPLPIPSPPERTVVAEIPDSPSEPTPVQAPPKRSLRMLAPILFALHMAVTLAGTNTDLLRAASLVAGGWALLLGLIMATCIVFRLTLDARDALRILGWAAVPIVLRAIIGLVGLFPHALQLHSSFSWLRPLDIFEGAAMTILGISFRKLPGSSLAKSILAAFFMALVWCLTARGYFRPF